MDVVARPWSGSGRKTSNGGESSRGAAGLRFTARISRSVFRGRQVQLDLEPEACPNQALRMMVESGRALPDPGSVGVFTVPQDRLHLMEI